MKNIAIITSGLLPMPAIKDGAIEMLLQYTLDYNEQKKYANLDVYSIYDKDAEEESKKYKNTKYIYIKINKILNKAISICLKILRKLGYKDPNFQYLYMKKVIKKLKVNSYDYIIVESDNHFAYHILKEINIPIVLYLHNDKLNSAVHNAKYIIEKCYKIFVVSEFLKNRVLTLGKEYNAKVDVILNGMDFNKFNLENYPEWRKQLREKFNITLNEYVYLFVGRIEPNKGVLELIKAYNLAKSGSKLVIAGGTFHSSTTQTKYFKKVLLEAAKNKDGIIFAGYIPHNEIAKFYAMADCLVVPSIWEEPAGLVNIEALISKLTLIANDVGGVKEYTTKDTILVKKDENLVNNLVEALNISQKNKNEIKNHRMDKFSKENYCKRYVESINNLGEK